MRLLVVGLFPLVFFQFGQAQNRELRITSGGGVSGMATVYTINPAGSVRKGTGVVEIEYSASGRLKKCTAKRYFREAESLMLSHAGFNHPGNHYTSISVIESGSERKITWGAADPPVPPDVKELYQKIVDKLGRLTFIPEPGK